MPATAGMIEPEAVVLSRLDAMLEMAKFVVVALVPVALAKTNGPVRVVDAEVRPPENAMRVVVAFEGNG